MRNYNYELASEGFKIAARTMVLAKQAVVLEDEPPRKFPAFAWPGGYTIIYVTREGDILCADCMNDPGAADLGNDSARVIGVDTYDDGPPDRCANCNAEIESSYGDPDEDEETDQ